jgi:hypothetical protein
MSAAALTSAAARPAHARSSARRARPSASLRLALAVVAVNAAFLGYHLVQQDWRIADGSALRALSALTLVNLAAAVLIRQQTVLNVLYGPAGRGSKTLELALGAVREFEADAVFVVSNKPTTTRLVGELERRGIPAFGPIWDS